MERRGFLAAGLSTCVALAGCTGSKNNSGSDGGGGDGSTQGGVTTTTDGDGNGASQTGDGNGGGQTGNGGSTPTVAEEKTLAGHPAAQSLDSQPMKGPDPSAATGVIVAFEDPSCPSCARFEQGVVPKIQSNLVDTGKVTFAFRGYPVVYRWGEPAVRALESTFDRSEEAFWSLAAHYFENQSEFGAAADKIYAMTETYLSKNTDLDAATVVSEAKNGAYDGEVKTDLEAGKAAGAGQTTPHLFLFRDGVYQTKVSGLVSYPVVKSALGL